MTEIETAGARLHVETWAGPGSEKPVLFLHGFTHTAATWDETARLLGRRALAPDLRGHGRTVVSDGRYDAASVVGDLVGLLEVIDAERAHLVGYSMGGRIAIAAALAHPVRWASLTLMSANPGIEDPIERAARATADDVLADRIEDEGVEPFARWWASLPLFAGLRRRPPDARRRLAEVRAGHFPGPLAAALRGMSVGRQPDYWPELEALTMPLLVLAGEEDERYAALAHRIGAVHGGASVDILRGTGHSVHLERPGPVAASLRRHVDACD